MGKIIHIAPDGEVPTTAGSILVVCVSGSARPASKMLEGLGNRPPASELAIGVDCAPEAASKLPELGVDNPEPWIAHVQVRGVVEIVSPRSGT